MLPKRSSPLFNIKMSLNILSTYVKKFVPKTLSKIAQSSHTGLLRTHLETSINLNQKFEKQI